MKFQSKIFCKWLGQGRNSGARVNGQADAVAVHSLELQRDVFQHHVGGGLGGSVGVPPSHSIVTDTSDFGGDSDKSGEGFFS